MEEKPEDMLAALIDKALKEIHSEFVFIRSIDEARAAKAYRRKLVGLVKYFKRSAKNILSAYLSEAKVNDDINLLLSYKTTEHCINYYQKEVAIVEDSLDEYANYLLVGPLIPSLLFNYYRPEEDLEDARCRNM